MPEEHPAFSAGEYIILAGEDQLEEIENRCSKVFMLGDVTANNMATHAKRKLFIKRVTMFHMGIPLYELDEMSGHWPEETILDLSLQQHSEHEMYSLASNYYHARTDVKSDRGLVQILDTKNQVLCSFVKDHASETANAINLVSQIRSKISFEIRYGFDGEYPMPDES